MVLVLVEDQGQEVKTKIRPQMSRPRARPRPLKPGSWL